MAARIVDFISLQLHVGVRLQLILKRDFKLLQDYSSLIGYSRNEYLIIKLPGGDLGESLRENDALEVRVFCGINVCVFETSVLKIFSAPFQYLHLAFPRNVIASELRSAARVKTELPATISQITAEESIRSENATVLNLSSTGALLQTKDPFANEGEECNLSFVADDANEDSYPLRLSALICKAHPRRAPGAPCQYGIRFTNVDRINSLVLRNLVYRIMMEDRQKVI